MFPTSLVVFALGQMSRKRFRTDSLVPSKQGRAFRNWMQDGAVSHTDCLKMVLLYLDDVDVGCLVNASTRFWRNPVLYDWRSTGYIASKEGFDRRFTERKIKRMSSAMRAFYMKMIVTRTVLYKDVEILTHASTRFGREFHLEPWHCQLVVQRWSMDDIWCALNARVIHRSTDLLTAIIRFANKQTATRFFDRVFLELPYRSWNLTSASMRRLFVEALSRSQINVARRLMRFEMAVDDFSLYRYMYRMYNDVVVELD